MTLYSKIGIVASLLLLSLTACKHNNTQTTGGSLAVTSQDGALSAVTHLTDQLINNLQRSKKTLLSGQEEFGATDNDINTLKEWLIAIKANPQIVNEKRTVTIRREERDDAATEEYDIIPYAVYCKAATPALIRALYALGATINTAQPYPESSSIFLKNTGFDSLSIMGLAVRTKASLAVLQVLKELGAEMVEDKERDKNSQALLLTSVDFTHAESYDIIKWLIENAIIGEKGEDDGPTWWLLVDIWQSEFTNEDQKKALIRVACAREGLINIDDKSNYLYHGENKQNNLLHCIGELTPLAEFLLSSESPVDVKEFLHQENSLGYVPWEVLYDNINGSISEDLYKARRAGIQVYIQALGNAKEANKKVGSHEISHVERYKHWFKKEHIFLRRWATLKAIDGALKGLPTSN